MTGTSYEPQGVPEPWWLACAECLASIVGYLALLIYVYYMGVGAILGLALF